MDYYVHFDWGDGLWELLRERDEGDWTTNTTSGLPIAKFETARAAEKAARATPSVFIWRVVRFEDDPKDPFVPRTIIVKEGP